MGINTRGGHDGHGSVAPDRPTKQARDRGPRHAKTYSTVGSQSGSAPHWLEAILQAPLKMYTGLGGRRWKACGSDVIQDDWGQTCLSWLQIGREAAWVIQRHRDVKRPDFSGWGDHVMEGGSEEWGAIIYLQRWQTHTCLKSRRESPVVHVPWRDGDHQCVKHQFSIVKNGCLPCIFYSTDFLLMQISYNYLFSWMT